MRFGRDHKTTQAKHVSGNWTWHEQRTPKPGERAGQQDDDVEEWLDAHAWSVQR